jgi:transposase
MDDSAGCRGCAARDAKIAELQARIADLAALVRDGLSRLKELEGKLADKPPAPRTAPKLPKAPDKKPSGRKPGGQPGHPPHLKNLVPPERVDKVIPIVPDTCERCQTQLPATAGANDPKPSRHQYAELPKVPVHVTEFQGHARTCPCCGHVTHAAIPAELGASMLGDRLVATMAYLTGAQGMSRRGVEETVTDIFGVPVSLGTVSNLEQDVAQSLAQAHTDATEAVRDAAVKNVDETGWKKGKTKHWLWVAATLHVAVFVIHPKRNIAALRSLLGGVLCGICCSDRWVVYRDWPDPYARQLCWAHLKRNWEKMVERGRVAKRYAVKCLAIHAQVFELWHLFRGGGCTRPELETRMQPLVEELQALIQAGSRSTHGRTQRFFARLLAESYGLWTFVGADGVEPTNNHGERVLRFAVIWRRRSFGCKSAAGCRYVERMLTVVQTLRLQKRNIIEFLADSIASHRASRPGPKLVSTG